MAHENANIALLVSKTDPSRNPQAVVVTLIPKDGFILLT